MRIRKYRILNQNVKVMKHDLSRTVHLATKGDFLYYFTGNLKKTFYVPIVRNIFLLILTVIITERFNIHFSRITWLVAILYSLLDCAPNFINAPLLFLLTLGQKIRNCYPLQNIFQTFDREHRKLLFSSSI